MQLISKGIDTDVTGTLRIPVSKYHAHRALVLAALADGVSIIHGISKTRQVEWTVSVLRALGAGITVTDESYVVTGTGGRFRAVPVHERGSDGESGVLDVGSSGTTLYFMTGLASLADRPMTLTGMKYFRRRPIKALLRALTELGIELSAEDGRPPVTVQPTRPRGGTAHIAGTLSQWVSGLLLVAPFAEADTTIQITGGKLNERSYVDLTVRMMRHWGLQVEVADDELSYTIPAGQVPRAADYTIPPDIGSAAFGIAAAALHPADVVFEGITSTRSGDIDHPEAGFLDIVAEMGVPLTLDEETGFLAIRHRGVRLRPFDLDATSIPDLVPILAVLATFADGTSHLHNVGHARLKESDRVAAMLQLNRLGAHASQEPTRLHVAGTSDARCASGALSSFNDHRVLMALAIAGSRSTGAVSLSYPHAYRVSYPEFLDAMSTIGLEIEVDAISQHDAEEAVLAHELDAADPDLLPALVRRYATERPDDAAVVEVGEGGPVTTSWRELQDEADRVSQMLVELGVEAGESVAVQLPNWREFAAIALGTMQIGAVVTPIMPVFGPREVCMTLTRAKARVLFLPDVFRGRRAGVELLAVAEEAAQQRRRLCLEHIMVIQASQRRGDGATELDPLPDGAAEHTSSAAWTWRYYEPTLASVSPEVELIQERMPALDDPCQLLFTSGTTGEPKGVVHPYRTLGHATALHVRRSGLNSSDRVFIPSPLAHQTGFLYGMLLAWQIGQAQVIQPIWSPRDALDQAFSQAGSTFVQAATPFLMDLVTLVENGDAPVPESLRMFVATGAAVPRELAHRATTVLQTAVLGAFGTTETCLATLSGPNDPGQSMWGTDGRALDGIRLRIVDDDGAEVIPGTEGNFVFSSPTLFGGYLERPDLTRDVFSDDGRWYRTGDLARIDENGYLHVTGRVKDIINRGGEKVPVTEIENLLYQHPLVADVALVAMPDPRLGERGCLFVVDAKPDDRLELPAMRDFLSREGVSTYYWPEHVEHLDELPRNPSGKVQKNILRERAANLAASMRQDITPTVRQESK